VIERDEMEAILALDKETVDKLVALAQLKQINANIEHIRHQGQHMRWTVVLGIFGVGAAFGALALNVLQLSLRAAGG